MAAAIQVTDSPGDGTAAPDTRSPTRPTSSVARVVVPREGSVVSHRQGEQRSLSSRHEIGKKVVLSVTGVHHVLNASARQEPHGVAEIDDVVSAAIVLDVRDLITEGFEERRLLPKCFLGTLHISPTSKACPDDRVGDL